MKNDIFIFSFVTIWFITVLIFIYRLILIFISQIYFKKIAKIKNTNYKFISIIIPARNEEENINKCIESFAKQNYPKDKFEIIVINDNSTDKTLEIIENLAKIYKNIKPIDSPILPKNWSGKNHACYIGYLNINRDSEYLCFIDADTYANSNKVLEDTMNFSLNKNLDLLSFSPMQSLISIEEKLFLPAIFLGIAGNININFINNQNKKEVVANGQFMLFKREIYEKIGTHETIKNIINEDITFARIIKKSGLKLFFAFATKDQFNVRMYKNIKSAWNGLIKNIADTIEANDKKIVTESIFMINLILEHI